MSHWLWQVFQVTPVILGTSLLVNNSSIATETSVVIPISKINTTHRSPRLPVPQSPRQPSVANLNENGIKLISIAIDRIVINYSSY